MFRVDPETGSVLDRDTLRLLGYAKIRLIRTDADDASVLRAAQVEQERIDAAIASIDWSSPGTVH